LKQTPDTIGRLLTSGFVKKLHTTSLIQWSRKQIEDRNGCNMLFAK